ncbi:MAG: hypothetical protein A2231_13265 [Candidatus Firestonebacteria bacterium RIFOXYA2_FULL_40_8]|nr:MAG: hypothetical protein A2231_13265 [Candidatus Firestonebacteria bacterium RIFOXYA2_FULL_40_8]
MKKRLGLGIFTALPSIFVLISTSVAVFSVVMESVTGKEMQYFQYKNLVNYITLIVPFISALFLVILLIYLYNVLTNEKLKIPGKLLWTVAIICAPFISPIIYWYVYIWKDKGNTIDK